MKCLLLPIAVLSYSIDSYAAESSLTTGYFKVEEHDQFFIKDKKNVCLGPSSNKRLEAALTFSNGAPTNIYPDEKACIDAGGIADNPPLAIKASAVEQVPPILEDCNLNPKAKTKIAAFTKKEFNAKELQQKKKIVAGQIHCLTSKESLKPEQEEQLSVLLAESDKLHNPTIYEEEQVSEGRIISSFELGSMKLPKYEDGKNEGFSDTQLYFDSRIDGRFNFEDLGVLLNASFDASFYGSGTFVEENKGTELEKKMLPTEFNDVSDTLDASFTLRLAADNCYDQKDKKDQFKYDILTRFASCLSSSTDQKSSLGLTLSYGFINKEKRLADEDTVNDYRAIGVEYRHYRKSIIGNSNRIPDFVVSYQRAKFEEYGVEQFTEGCIEAPCFRPIEGVYRYVVKLKYRLITDKPYFIGFRINAGPGADDYGLTLGIRKSGKSMLDIFGIK